MSSSLPNQNSRADPAASAGRWRQRLDAFELAVERARYEASERAASTMRSSQRAGSSHAGSTVRAMEDKFAAVRRAENGLYANERGGRSPIEVAWVASQLTRQRSSRRIR